MEGPSKLALPILPKFGELARIGRASQHGPSTFARISCNTFLESLKQTDQPSIGFVDVI